MGEENKHLGHEDAKVLYSQAYHFYNAGLYTKAKDCFRVLAAIQPLNYNYWYGLGASCQMLKDFDSAVQAYSLGALADKDEQDPYPHLHAAECLMALKKFERAEKALTSAETIARQHNLNQKLLDQIEQLRLSIKKVEVPQT